MSEQDVLADAFFDGLSQYLVPLGQFLEDNLHDTQERINAETRFAEFQFWVSECVANHGVKPLS